MDKMQADKFASALKAGERPGCNGLVLIVGWRWGSQHQGYQQLASEMRRLDDSHTLVYDGEYTHCTCATISSFKNPRSVFFHASPADRERIILAWQRSLEAAFARTEGVLHPFEIVFRSLETSPAATFLRADDASIGMESLRAVVKDAACDPQLGGLSVELEAKYSGAHPELFSLKDALHLPSIIHSTIMRVAVQPSGPAEARLAEGLADLGARWEPATVQVGAMSLVHERHPYMHLRREGGERHCYSLPSR